MKFTFWNTIIALTALLIFAGIPAPSLAATISFSAPEQITVGTEFSVYVYASSTDQGFNAAEATITFSNDVLEVISLDSTRSATIFNFWLAPPTFSNEEGTVTFSGGTTNGVLGSDIPLLTIHMRATGGGDALVSASDASVNASDGKGTNILEDVYSLRRSVPEATVTVPAKSTTPTAPPITEPVITEEAPAQTFAPQFPEAELSCTGLFANCGLPHPSIDSVTKRLHKQVGADIRVSGTAAQGAHVHLLLLHKDVRYKEITAVIQEDGTWEGTLSNIFAYGTYSLHAWVESADSSQKSEHTIESTINVYPPYTLYPFGYVLRWYALISMGLGVLTLLIGAIVFYKRVLRKSTRHSYIAEIFLGITVLAFIVMVAWAYVLWKKEYSPVTTFWKDTDIPCILRAPSFIDIYAGADLSIYVDGTLQPIPSDIGIHPECVALVHTHDNTGHLHFKPNNERPATLPDFFTVAWVAFNREGYTLQVTVNSEDYTDRISSYALRNEDVIEMRYTSIEENAP